MNEQGQVEVDRLRFSLEPFLFMDGKLVTWDQVSTRPSLRDGSLPIPSVSWTYNNGWELTVEAVAGGTREQSLLGVRYALKCKSAGVGGKLFIAIRPFQVNPPWQALNIEGGTARIDSMDYRDGVVYVDGTPVIPLTPPSAFGALEFDQGDITDFMARGTVPQAQHVRDHAGHASAAFSYDLRLRPGESKEISFIVPFHGWDGAAPTPYDTAAAGNCRRHGSAHSRRRRFFLPGDAGVCRTHAHDPTSPTFSSTGMARAYSPDREAMNAHGFATDR